MTISNPIPRNNLKGDYAGFFSRTIAMLIDIAIINATVVIGGWIITITVNILDIGPVLNFMKNIYPNLESNISYLFNPTYVAIFIFVLVILYFLFFLSFSGHTPGKALMGLRVVPMHGGKMSFIRSSLRFVAYAVSIIPLFLGFFWIIFDDRRQGWHDKIANTCVIYSWDARPDERFLARAVKWLDEHRK
jgi:uncharacterized RDD family membrane protein YckC